MTRPNDHDDAELLKRRMRALVVEHARSDSARSSARVRRQRFVGVLAGLGAVTAVTVGALTLAFAGQSPTTDAPPAATAPETTAPPSASAPPTEPPTAPPAPPVETPTTPADPVEPDAPEIDRVAGYDAEAAWNACLAAGSETYAGVYTATSSYSPDSVIAPIAVGQEGVEVTIAARVDYGGVSSDSAWFCGVGGDVDQPTVLWTDVRDK